MQGGYGTDRQALLENHLRWRSAWRKFAIKAKSPSDRLDLSVSAIREVANSPVLDLAGFAVAFPEQMPDIFACFAAVDEHSDHI